MLGFLDAGGGAAVRFGAALGRVLLGFLGSKTKVHGSVGVLFSHSKVLAWVYAHTNALRNRRSRQYRLDALAQVDAAVF